MTGKPLLPPGQSCTCEIRVRYAECDAQGYLHHARYWEYFEQVRTELLRNNGIRYRDLEAGGTVFVVYKAAVRYRKPIRYDDLVKVSTTVTRISRTRVDHTYTITRDGVTTCEASTTLACVGPEGKPSLMPEELWSPAVTESVQARSAVHGRRAGKKRRRPAEQRRIEQTPFDL